MYFFATREKSNLFFLIFISNLTANQNTTGAYLYIFQYGVNVMYATIQTRTKVILRSICDPLSCGFSKNHADF